MDLRRGRAGARPKFSLLCSLLKGGVAVDRRAQVPEIRQALPHGHVAAVLGTLRSPSATSRASYCSGRDKNVIMAKKFQRRTEGFTCERCGCRVLGNGYTNHCPACLWSKHVDVMPGDRASKCGGPMEPIDVQLRKGQYILLHECLVCGHVKLNKSAREDNFEQILIAARKAVPRD